MSLARLTTPEQRMNAPAEVRVIKTAAETALANAYTRGAHAAAGRRRDRRAARGRLRYFRQGRPAASPRRGVEVYRPARADARGEAARRARPMPRPRPAPRPRDKMLGDVETRRIVFVDGAFVPELSDTAALERGLTVGSLAAALADRRSGAHGKSRQAGAGERCRRRAQYRADGRRRGHPHRRRLDHRAAAASDLCRFGKARRELRALARRRRAGRAGHADREPRRPGRQRLSGQCGARNGGRRRRPCRSRENHRRRRRRAARLDARRRRSAPRRASTPSPSPSAAPWCATSCF